jgi:hypothetical protein
MVNVRAELSLSFMQVMLSGTEEASGLYKVSACDGEHGGNAAGATLKQWQMSSPACASGRTQSGRVRLAHVCSKLPV